MQSQKVVFWISKKKPHYLQCGKLLFMLFKIFKLLKIFILSVSIPLFVASESAMGGEKELPLWEVGLGIAPITMPSYRGARSRELYPVPLPYIDYRGDYLRIDREGVRGLLYDSDRIRLDLSGDGAIPAATDEDGPREGMPDLDPILEFGPSLNITLMENPGTRLRLRLPVRVAMAVDFFSIYHAGWKAHPHISFDAREALRGWNVGTAIGPLFADKKYHAFYYDVAGRYANESRKRYRSGGGYSGTSLMLTTSRRFRHVWAGMFLRYDNLAGATFIDSPLVETRHSVMAGFGIAYIFRKSAKTVPATRDDLY